MVPIHCEGVFSGIRRLYHRCHSIFVFSFVDYFSMLYSQYDAGWTIKHKGVIAKDVIRGPTSINVTLNNSVQRGEGWNYNVHAPIMSTKMVIQMASNHVAL